MDCKVKREIVELTYTLIIRDGIRAVRVDDIAQALGISKRTLYEQFPAKEDLIRAGVDHALDGLRKKLDAIRSEDTDVFSRFIGIAWAYIGMLHKIECAFWRDINRSLQYRDLFSGHRELWMQEFESVLDECRKQGYILPRVNIRSFITMLMQTLYNAHMMNSPHSFGELRTSAYIMIRGIATFQGIDILERHTGELSVFDNPRKERLVASGQWIGEAFVNKA